MAREGIFKIIWSDEMAVGQTLPEIGQVAAHLEEFEDTLHKVLADIAPIQFGPFVWHGDQSVGRVMACGRKTGVGQGGQV